jgi:glycosyltransferase involved in cell wall biosynthesis
MPEVSVNICCYNSEKFIRQTLESVLNQTFKDFEIVIVDDGSEDRTGEIINEYKDGCIKYYYQQNKGLSASRNRAIELSSGKYIALLDHDDIWSSKKLEKQMQLFRDKPKLGLIFSNCYFRNEKKGKTRLYFKRDEDFHENPIGKFFIKDYIPLLTIILKKDIVKSIGGFSEKYITCMDYDFIFRYLKKYKFDYLNEPLATYILHGSNTFLKHSKKAHEEELQVIKRYMKVFPEVVENNQREIKQRIAKIYAHLAGNNLLMDNICTAKEMFEKSKEMNEGNLMLWGFNLIFRINPNIAKYLYKSLR